MADRSYGSRFWTQFEAWLSYQSASDDGLIGTATSQMRATVDCLHGTPEFYARALEAEWYNANARAAYEKLSSPDVAVTNQSDKDVQLPKIAMLDEMVRTLMMKHTAHLGPMGGSSTNLNSSAGGGLSAVRAAGAASTCKIGGLAELLENCKILDKLDVALQWCEEQGVDSIEEVREVGAEACDEFVAALGLKPIKKKLVMQRLSGSDEGGSPSK